MSKMLDFGAVIRELGNKAVKDYCGWMERDDKALESLKSSDVGGIVDWLRYYGVLQSFTSKERADIAERIVKWAKDRIAERDLSSARLLDEAHKEMTKACVGALGRERGFISLSSKALWLCYPQQVPIYVSFVRRALTVLSRLEGRIEPAPKDLSEYGKFAHIWMHFFDTYADSLKDIDMKACRYPVRVLDTILWTIGVDSFQE